MNVYKHTHFYQHTVFCKFCMRINHWHYGHVQDYAPIDILIATDINLIETKESVHTKALFNVNFLHQNYLKSVECCHLMLIRVTEGWNVRVYGYLLQNKTTHPISSKSHPLATANKAIYCLKWRGWLTKPTEHHKLLTQYVAVHPAAVSVNYSSSGMLTILIKSLNSIIYFE